MPPFSFMEGALKFVDVRFARWCHKKKIPHILMPHPENWMPRSGDDEHSIWNSFTQKRPIKRSLEVVQYCYKVPNQTLPK
jgi:hypothetical protein